MSKAPAFQWYTGDWLKDPALSRCAPATRGIWADMLSAMWENNPRGELSGTAIELARVCRCLPDELCAAVAEISGKNVATVTEDNGLITVVSRRMKRDEKARKNNKIRQKRYRKPPENPDSNADVTPLSQRSSSSSSSSTSVKEISQGLSLPQDLSPSQDLTFAPPTRRDRAPDEIWDAVLEACGLNHATPTKSERGAWNAAVKQLREIGATPTDIRVRAAQYRRHWPKVSLTPTALARRWNECQLGPGDLIRARVSPPDLAADAKTFNRRSP